MRCSAKNRSGKQCKNTAEPGKKVCYMHGGLTPSGPASPNYKHGRYSKYLPAAMLDKYTEAQKDPDLLNLRDEIALNDVLIKQLISKLPDGGGSKSWKEVRAAWHELTEAVRDNDQDKQTELLRKLNDIITKGAQEAEVWNDLITSMDNRRKLTASEAKRLTDMQQYITSEKAIALVYAILDIIRRNVEDKNTLSLIATQVRALVTLPNKTS